MNHSTAIRVSATTALLVAIARPVLPQPSSPGPYPPPIVSITVLDANQADTHQIVLAPIGSHCNNPDLHGRCSLNDAHESKLLATSDQKQTIFPPGALGGNREYLFWVASGTAASQQTFENAPAIGAVVLAGGAGGLDATTGVGLDSVKGQWTLQLAPSYGSYKGLGHGPVLLPVAGGSDCPTVPSPFTKTDQDPTFDLTYAAPGTVVKDPAGPPNNLFMIYFAGNHCAGVTSGAPPNHSGYMTTAVATSTDNGHHWPTYKYPLPFLPLPEESLRWPGPNAPTGAFDSNVKVGNTAQQPPANFAPYYGRYPVLTPENSLTCIFSGTSCPPKVIGGQSLKQDYGDGEPSAFVDDVSGTWPPYLYVVHGYAPGQWSQSNPDLGIARAPLGVPRLSFLKWYLGHYDSVGSDPVTGAGGPESPLLSGDGTPNPYANCLDSSQRRHMGSIDYVEETHQYLLTFVCDSPTDPATEPRPTAPGTKVGGSAWFFATSDHLDPPQFAPADKQGTPQPREIVGTWGAYTPGGPCDDYKGYYPTFMSLQHASGHLSLTGYAFYLSGCQSGQMAAGSGGRQYASRQFKITTTDTAPPVTKATVSGPLGQAGWYTGTTTVTLSATDDGSGAAITESSVDGGVTWQRGLTRTFSTDDVYTLLFRSIDVDGNVEKPNSITVEVDSTPPVTLATAQYVPLPGAGTMVMQVKFSATDNVSGVARTEYSLDRGATWTTSQMLTLRDGTYVVSYRSVDVAGNVERPRSMRLVVRTGAG